MQGSLVYILAAVVAALALAALAGFLAFLAWRRLVRRQVVRLIGRREAVRAGERSLRGVVIHLAESPVEVLVAFAADPEHEDRRSLTEVASRMEVQSDDLISMPLPKRLWRAGELLADAAWRVGLEAERVTRKGTPDEVLDGIADIDLLAVREAVAEAEAEVERLEEEHGVEEAAVYGGGLYI